MAPVPMPDAAARTCSFLRLSSVALALSACTVVKPPGWPVPEPEPVLIEATPWRPYGFAPTSWDLPGGERIAIDVKDLRQTSTFGDQRLQADFAVSLGGERVRCATEPAGADVPETRFGCWSADRKDVSFWLAPGAGCSGRPRIETLGSSRCWNGEATVRGQRVLLDHAFLAQTGSPVGYVTWRAGDGGRLLLAADIVPELTTRLYLPERPVPPEIHRRLVLLTVALSFWEHAQSSD